MPADNPNKIGVKGSNFDVTCSFALLLSVEFSSLTLNIDVKLLRLCKWLERQEVGNH